MTANQLNLFGGGSATIADAQKGLEDFEAQVGALTEAFTQRFGITVTGMQVLPFTEHGQKEPVKYHVCVEARL